MRKFNPIWTKPLYNPYAAMISKYPRLAIEIGAGVGYHAIQYATNQPNTLVVAIERTKTKFHKFSQRAQNHTLPNLLPIFGDAVPWIYKYISTYSVDEYFILYPNPYPKASQKNKRFHYMPFIQYLVSTIKQNGQISQATNDLNYHAQAREIFSKQLQLEITKDKQISTTDKPRTHFEKKYLAREETCFDLIVNKK